jgi:hypothetical protein
MFFIERALSQIVLTYIKSEKNGKQTSEHAFSVEMKSKEYIKQLSVNSKGHTPVLFEGILGDLKNLSLVEDLVLEINGDKGILRIDLAKDDLMELFKKGSSES